LRDPDTGNMEAVASHTRCDATKTEVASEFISDVKGFIPSLKGLLPRDPRWRLSLLELAPGYL